MNIRLSERENGVPERVSNPLWSSFLQVVSISDIIMTEMNRYATLASALSYTKITLASATGV